MTRQCFLLQPDGPDSRALEAYLIQQGIEVQNLEGLDAVFEACRGWGSITTKNRESTVLHGPKSPVAKPTSESTDDLDNASILVHSSFLDATHPPGGVPSLERVCVLCPTEADQVRVQNWKVGLAWPIPFRFQELDEQISLLAQRTRRQPKLSVSAAATASPERPPETDAPTTDPEFDADRQASILGALGGIFAPRVAAAEGWLQLLLQDIASDDPAHRHLSHTLRELREIDRIARLLRSHHPERRAYLGPLRLNSLLREIIAAQGASPIPISLSLAKDLPEVRADTRLLRSALGYLLRAALEPANRSRALSWATRASGNQVILEFVEEGHRLTSSQLEALTTPGLSLLYNPVERGLGYPVAIRTLERCGVECMISAEVGRRLRLEFRFETLGRSPRLIADSI